MRVTEQIQYSLVGRRLATLHSEYQTTATQASTGQRINAPSDDPVAAAQASRVRSSISDNRSFQRTVDMVRPDVEMSESCLAEASEVFQRAQEIAMAGANGATGSAERTALATEARQLVQQLTQIANTKGSQGYLFSGTRIDTQPFDEDGNFTGNDAEHRVQTGAGDAIAVNISGARAFTATGGRDTFQDLKDLANALETNDLDGIQASLDTLKVSGEQINRERSYAGLVINRLDLSESILSLNEVSLAEWETDAISAPTEDTYSRLVQLEGSITSSVEVGKRMLQLSLVDRFS